MGWRPVAEGADLALSPAVWPAIASASHLVAAILGTELLAGRDAHDLSGRTDRAPGTAALQAQVRALVPPFRNDRSLADHLALGRNLVRAGLAPVP